MVGADVKAINAAHFLFTEALKALDEFTASSAGFPEAASGYDVVFQSEAILKNPSDYWVSVMNVGRQLQLHSILPPNLSAELEGAEQEQVGQVVSALMHVGDVMGTSPRSVSYAAPLAPPLFDVVRAYFESMGLEIPVLHEADRVVTWLKEKTEKSGHGSVDDDYLVGDDPKAGANKKMKRAFCEPTNVSINPPLFLARHVGIDLFGEMRIDDGLSYSSGDVARMFHDFEHDVLTPQKLKPAVTAVMAQLLEAIQSTFKASKEVKKAQGVIKNHLKKKKVKK